MEGAREIDLVGALGDPALIVGESDVVVTANDRLAKLVGRDGEDLIGAALADLLERSPAGDYLLHHSGEHIEVALHVGALPSGARLITARDLGPDRRVASQLADAESIAGVAIWEWHLKTDEVIWSAEAFRLFGADPGTEPTFELWLAAVHPEDREWVSSYVQEAMSAQTDYDFQHRIQRPDGEVRHLHCRGQVEQAPDGTLIRLVGVSQDITDRVRKDEELRYLAEHDGLTGLLNRRRFEEEVERAAREAAERETPLAVLLLDLDHFKDVNDTRGHASGDQLIRSISRSLRDEVGPDGVLARLGGDEFAVMLSPAGEEEALAAAERLRERVADHLIVSGGSRLQVTASVGVATLPGGDPLDVLPDADVAMYDAKEGGRNRVTAYRTEHGARDRMEARLAWTTLLRRALDTDGFELHAQRILPLGDAPEKQRRFELLLRLPHPGGGVDPAKPAEFLPVAERHGLIREIDRWVVAKAVEIAAAYRRAGDPVRLEVNLSGQSMVDPTLPGYIAEVIKGGGAEPSQLIFEVTETAAIDSLHEAGTLADSLIRLGCEFAIDDFGAGFGSFAYLKHLPSQYVKIDGDFIRRLPSSPNDQLVVRAIATIAKGMGKRTIAEFVETEETLAILRDYGIDFAQGHVVALPGPVTKALGIPARGRKAI